MTTNTLFVAGLPPGCSLQSLEAAFTPFSGFVCARLRGDRTRKLVGFVEFEDAESAASALEARQGHRFRGRGGDGQPIGVNIEFAKSRVASPARSTPHTRKRPRVDEHAEGTSDLKKNRLFSKAFVEASQIQFRIR